MPAVLLIEGAMADVIPQEDGNTKLLVIVDPLTKLQVTVPLDNEGAKGLAGALVAKRPRDEASPGERPSGLVVPTPQVPPDLTG